MQIALLGCSCKGAEQNSVLATLQYKRRFPISCGETIPTLHSSFRYFGFPIVRIPFVQG